MELADEILGITAAKTELPARIKRLQNGMLERVVIVRQNNPVAVIVGIQEYERMRQIEAQRELLDDLRLVVEALDTDDGSRIDLDEIKAKLGID